MKVSSRIWIGFIFALLSCSAFAAQYKPGEIIVKYKSGSVRTRIAMTGIYNALGVERIERLAPTMEHLYLKDSVKVEDAIADIQKYDVVEYAQPNYLLFALPTFTTTRNDPPGMPGGGGALPCIPGMDIPGCDPKACIAPGVPFPPGCTDGGPGPGPGPGPDPGKDRPVLAPAPGEVNPPVADPELSKAYGMTKIQAEQAWKIHRGSKSFIVADIDTGIDYNHEDIAFNVWRNPKPGAKNDVVGYDFIHDDGLPFDDQGHGTHTAGTIGAVGGNGKGVSGVAQVISIMSVKFLSAQGQGDTAGAIKSIDYAIDHGAKVLSNSWGGPGDQDNKALFDSIERAKAKDVLFIAAAGNGGNDQIGDDNDTSPDKSYPAAFDNDNLISVAATDEGDKLTFFSNYGLKSTHLAAPGMNVYSTMPGNRYAQESGTSMACPHVAGAAALLWSKHPEWDYKHVKKVLMDSVDQLPSLQGKTVTGGRLNIFKALQAN